MLHVAAIGMFPLSVATKDFKLQETRRREYEEAEEIGGRVYGRKVSDQLQIIDT
jgi:hypothetical protein